MVGIGASAGGMTALKDLLSNLPADPGMAFVVVSHLDPTRKSELSGLLGRITAMPVEEIRQGMQVRPNRVYVIPPARTLTISGDTLKLGARTAAGRSPPHPIDAFLCSLAESRDGVSIAIILSGTGTDGAEGIRAVKTKGGMTFAQDEKSAEHANMPAAAVATGCVDFTMPPRAMAKELVRLKSHPYLQRRRAGSASREGSEVGALRRIFEAVRAQTGVDFSHYKPPTVMRRIQRRMAVHRLQRLEAYARFVRRHPREVTALHDDLLINVTEFFRDPGVFLALQKRILPRLLKGRAPGTPIRIWVPGCSSGEEVYSLAITLLEGLGRRVRDYPLQFFGTDISERALERARTGLYPASIESHVSRERLRRYFAPANGGYQIGKSIRELCIFAVQDLTRDPPFSNLDLISCRNLMIYLGPLLQRRAMTTFHYALRPHGWLVLGSSETIVGFENLFGEADKRHKIYERKPSASRPSFDYPFHAARTGASGPAPRLPSASWRELDVHKEADRLLLRRYAPAGVLVNEDLDILQIRGRTGSFLEPSPGTPSLNLLKMAREGLFMDLRQAILQARRRGAPVRRENVPVKTNGDWQSTNIEIIPLKGPVSRERHYLVVFEPAAPAPVRTAPARPDAVRRTAQREIARLKEDLVSNRDYVKSIIEDLEDANESLKAANEEIQSSNEELQSTNEELETAKEELQSTNEELTTVNEELTTRNAELAALNNDLTNLLASVNLPILMLGPDRRVRRMTPMAEKVLRLEPSDMGRAVEELRLPLEVPHLDRLVGEAMDTAGMREREVRDGAGRWYLLQVWPYRTADHRVDGAVLVLVDIHERKRALLEAQQARDYAETIVETVPEPLLVLDDRLRVRTANRSFYETFKVTKADTENRPFLRLGNGQWNRPELRKVLGAILPRGTRLDKMLVEHDFPGIGRRSMLVSARRLDHLPSGQPSILVDIEDVTERLRAEAVRARLAAIVESSRDAICSVDPKGRIVSWNEAARRIFGYSPAEALGRSLLLIHPPNRRGELRTLMQKRTVTNFETVRRRKDGRLCDIAMTVSPMQNVAGRLVGYAFISRDITEQNRMRRSFEEHAALLRSVVANMPLALFALDGRGRITFLEGRGLEAMGLKSARTADPLRPDSKARLPFDSHAVRRALDGEEVTWNGAVGGRYCEIRLTPLKDGAGRTIGAIGVSIDVTDRRRLEAEIQHVSESERKRLGGDLHDSLAQQLVAVKFGAGLLHNKLAALSLPEAADARKLDDQIGQSLQQIRSLVRELIPVELELWGFEAALERLAQTTRELHGIECACHVRSDVRFPDESTALQLYRIAQEALTNAAKHSRATRIRMELSRSPAGVELRIHDNGRGFAKSRSAAGLGLHVMQYRADIIGAKLQIESDRLHGTTVACTLKDAK